ncbi:hypothetical protein MSAN_00884500 [Mycena sanguinolenta]|uniref:Transmembrane protein n=1 Tax=Mycena sanguinolenta TaxID=230812 RepID=A0A8H7DBS6_9AGAR|nr:hypothetical protein MSAN_00884500 [Mycena sanguinolenta]
MKLRPPKGFAVPQQNFLVSTQFLLSFFPNLFVMPIGYLWRVLDCTLRQYQPYVTLANGNATAEESVLLDYICLGPIFSVFHALKYKHRVIFWSSLLATWTYLFTLLAGSIFQLQTRGQTQNTDTTSLRSLGLAPDVSQLKGFAAAAGFVQASVFNNVSDPPFVYYDWAVAPFVIPPHAGFNGTMVVNTTAIRTNSTCSNPTRPPTIAAVNSTSSIISATSIDNCTGNIIFEPTLSTQQYGVSPVPNCGPHTSLNGSFLPVVFWQQQVNGTPEVRTIFCTPTLELFYVNAVADLNGSLTAVRIVNSSITPNNLSSDPLYGVPFNAVIFPETANPFIEARAQGISIGVPGAIFQAALQQFNGLQSIFDLPNGFLDLTNKFYLKHLVVTAQNVYFVAENTQLASIEILQVPRLWIDPFPAHILALLMIISGILGLALQLIGRWQRRNIFLAAPPGSIAAALALTSRSGFGELLLPRDDIAMIEKKLDKLRFRLDKRSGAIVADDYEEDDWMRGRKDAMMSLLGSGYNRQGQSRRRIQGDAGGRNGHSWVKWTS